MTESCVIENQIKENVKKRNYWLDNTKFFVIFLVVIGHFLEELISNRTIKEVFIFIYTFHMPLFIFITGFFSKNVEKSRKRTINYLMLLIIAIPIATEKIEKLTRLLQGKASYETMKMGTMGALYRAVWYIVATIASFSILSIIPKRKIACISKFGTRTLQVYCLHILVILVLRKLNVYKSIDTIEEFCYLISFAIVLVPILSLKIFSYPFDFIMGKRRKTINNKGSKNEYKEKNKAVIE